MVTLAARAGAVFLTGALVCGCGAEPSSRGMAPVETSPGKSTAAGSPRVTLAPRVRVPAGVRASYVVFDRKLGRVVLQRGPRWTFRSASVVKLLLVLDYLREHEVTAGDRALLGVMLRSSDDKAATEFWRRGGQAAIIGRMVPRLGLTETAPPPI